MLSSGLAWGCCTIATSLIYYIYTLLRSSWGYVEVFCILQSTWGSSYFYGAIILRTCTELLPNSIVGLSTVLWLTQGFWDEDLIIPPVTWGYLYGGRPHASGNTAELSILEFYLYTYNMGPDSTIGVLLTLKVLVSGINVGL